MSSDGGSSDSISVSSLTFLAVDLYYVSWLRLRMPYLPITASSALSVSQLYRLECFSSFCSWYFNYLGIRPVVWMVHEKN